MEDYTGPTPFGVNPHPPALDLGVWHVVFGPARPNYRPRGFRARFADWLVRRLPVGYQHCWAYRLTYKGWVIVDPSSALLQIGEAPADLHDRMMVEAKAGSVLIFRVPAQDSSTPAWPLPQTCARTIAHLLGLSDFTGLTPYALAKHLANLETTEVFAHGRRITNRA